jgi:hypothetical protein
MTTEERIELLKKAREKKAMIKAEMDAQKPTPVKGRPKKVKEEEPKTLDLVDEIIEKEEEIKPVEKPKKVIPVKQEDDDADVEEQIVYEKAPKKKKKIIRKIIRQVESSDDDVEEEIIYERAPKKTIQARPHQVERPRPQTPPRQVEVEPVRNPFFNY